MAGDAVRTARAVRDGGAPAAAASLRRAAGGDPVLCVLVLAARGARGRQAAPGPGAARARRGARSVPGPPRVRQAAQGRQRDRGLVVRSAALVLGWLDRVLAEQTADTGVDQRPGEGEAGVPGVAGDHDVQARRRAAADQLVAVLARQRGRDHPGVGPGVGHEGDEHHAQRQGGGQQVRRARAAPRLRLRLAHRGQVPPRALLDAAQGGAVPAAAARELRGRARALRGDQAHDELIHRRARPAWRGRRHRERAQQALHQRARRAQLRELGRREVVDQPPGGAAAGKRLRPGRPRARRRIRDHRGAGAARGGGAHPRRQRVVCFINARGGRGVREEAHVVGFRERAPGGGGDARGRRADVVLRQDQARRQEVHHGRRQGDAERDARQQRRVARGRGAVREPGRHVVARIEHRRRERRRSFSKSASGKRRRRRRRRRGARAFPRRARKRAREERERGGSAVGHKKRRFRDAPPRTEPDGR